MQPTGLKRQDEFSLYVIIEIKICIPKAGGICFVYYAMYLKWSLWFEVNKQQFVNKPNLPTLPLKFAKFCFKPEVFEKQQGTRIL